MFAVLVVRRGADALTRCLAVLGRDLSTPVPRSRVTELNSVADGIADLARELARAQSELAERERIAVLGRVTAGVAHELRNPLAVMKLRIDLMRRNSKVPREITPELDIVVEEVVRLDRLVNDLLTIAGRRLSEQRELDVGDLARHRVELMRPLAAEKHVAIEVSGSATSRVDPDAIARVSDNVLKNAIEAAPSRMPEVRVVGVGCDDRGAWGQRLRCERSRCRRAARTRRRAVRAVLHDETRRASVSVWRSLAPSRQRTGVRSRTCGSATRQSSNCDSWEPHDRGPRRRR